MYWLKCSKTIGKVLFKQSASLWIGLKKFKFSSIRLTAGFKPRQTLVYRFTDPVANRLRCREKYILLYAVIYEFWLAASSLWVAFTTRWLHWSQMKNYLFWFSTPIIFAKQNETSFIQDQYCYQMDDGSPLDCLNLMLCNWGWHDQVSYQSKI